MEELPSHILVEILSRLPVKTIIHCNCVCKSWRDLVSDSHFANIHLSRSPAGLMIHQMKDLSTGLNKPGVLRWVEILDDLNHQCVLHDPVMSLDLATVFPKAKLLQVGSVDGLLCLWEFSPKCDNTHVCNPITREYISLPRQSYHIEGHANDSVVYGFGVGLQTKEYKVVRIFQRRIPQKPSETSQHMVREAEVYTIGTGQWRSLGHVPYQLCGHYGPFLNGNVHWVINDNDSLEKLCTFNIDKETFQLFPSRPPDDSVDDSEIDYESLTVLKGCLCECYVSCYYDITIWVMKEYGVKNSWHKEVVIAISVSPPIGWLKWNPVYPVAGLKDGSILMVYYGNFLFKYCPKTKSDVMIEMFERYFKGIAYRPSFLKLERFKSERVQVISAFDMS